MQDATGMKLSKISLLHYNERKKRFETHTTLSAGGQSLKLTGLPTVTIFAEFVQLGCVRVSYACVKELADAVIAYQRDENLTSALTLQAGDYNTDDPNAQPNSER